MKLSAALKDIVVGVENAPYFTSTTPADYEAREYFRGVRKRQEVHRLWAYTIIPRMIASKHSGLHQAGIRLQKQWKSKVYRKEVDIFWREQETIRTSQTTITQSVQMHQARILQHSYKDLCNTLERREESFKLRGEDKDKTEFAQQEPGASDLVAEEPLTQDGNDSDSEGTNLSEKDEEEQEKDVLSTFTSEDYRLFAEAYLNIKQKVTLPSGRVLEDVLFHEGLAKKNHHLIHSFIIDEGDDGVRSLFDPEDWTFIATENPREVTLDDPDVSRMLKSFQELASTADVMKALQDRPARLGANYVFSKDYELKWLLDSISKWADLYNIQPNIFAVDGLTEYFWRSNVWSILDSLFYDLPNFILLGGESWGIESTKRRNQQKEKSGKKIGGSKGDGYLREFGPKKADWLSIEGAKQWDTDGFKYKRESSWKIGRQLHDILRSRMAEMDEKRAMSLNTYGFVFGGPTIQLHLLSTLGGATTILRRRKPLTLASSVEEFGNNVTILEFILLVKRDIVQSTLRRTAVQDAWKLFAGAPSTPPRSTRVSVEIQAAHRTPTKRKAQERD
ncbi:hypothetical protein BGZ83_010424 [Gryganskiella cystojenkinii]|nr:hypothetical protein BGZ83_010424 [Gryganskiella cystojenkinii]